METFSQLIFEYSSHSVRIITASEFSADLYIFDEITSSLYVITKRKMISSIFNFLNGKTIFFITHDLSYLKLFDKVIFLDNGKIEIEGSYDYVIKNSIKFRDYLKQNKNYEAT